MVGGRGGVCNGLKSRVCRRFGVETGDRNALCLGFWDWCAGEVDALLCFDVLKSSMPGCLICWSPAATRFGWGGFGGGDFGELSVLCLGVTANVRPMKEGETAAEEFLAAGDLEDRFASTLKREIAPSDPRHFEGGGGAG
jgi:hypothetical protein